MLFRSIVFIEKPGLQNKIAWEKLIKNFPNTRFMMVKNNQYRNEIKHFKELAAQSTVVKLKWINKNRIPNPGSWFTEKSLAFGGVSRDLIPHMLSYYTALTDFTKGKQLSAKAEQRWNLDQIDSTDYGVINHKGQYDVDDRCELVFVNKRTRYEMVADWRSMDDNDISISFDMPGRAIRYQLNLCPESAYKAMIEQAVKNIDNTDFWQQQLAQDLWIHQQIENL